MQTLLQISARDTVGDSVSLKIIHELPVKPSVDTTEDFQSLVFQKEPPLPSFFTSQQLVPKSNQPLPFKKYQPDWILGIFLFSFILLAWLNVFHYQRLKQVLAAPFSKRYMNQLMRDGNLFSERIALVLGIIYLLIVPLLVLQVFVFRLESRIDAPFNGWKLYLIIMASISGYWLLKVVAIKILGAVFKTAQTTSSYLTNSLIISFLASLCLLPMLIFIVYLKSGILLYFAIALFGIFFVFRFLRGFLVGISLTRFSYLYLFVYLCILEILPLIVLTKVFLRYYF